MYGGAENAGVENAGVEKAGVDSRSGKYRSENVWKAVKAENKLYH